MTARWLRWLVGAGALAAAGCQAPQTAPASSVLRAAVRADVTGFFPNPPAANESYTFEMNRWVLDAVVALDRGLNVAPALAAHWLTPDDRTIVLELRPGLRFSDGRPVTATDVAASLEAGKRLRWPNDGYLATIASVRALDERRVEVRAARPDPTLLARLAWGFVMPEDVAGPRPGPPVGTAPYTLESWTPGQSFTFARNPRHWGAPAAFARAEFRVVPDDEERLRLVRSGEADLADFVPPEAWASLEQDERLRLVVGEGLRVLFLGLRVDRKPFSDPRVREALDLAIDRRALLERVFLGKGSVANQLMPRGSVGYVPEMPASPYDPARARRLLAAAGLRPGHALRLDGPKNRYVRDVQLMHEVARQLESVRALSTTGSTRGRPTSSCSAGPASPATAPTSSRCCSRRPARSCAAARTPAGSRMAGSTGSRSRRSRRGWRSCARSCRSWCSPTPSSTTAGASPGTRP